MENNCDVKGCKIPGCTTLNLFKDSPYEVLRKYQYCSWKTQQQNRKEIVKAFKQMWDIQPPEEIFAGIMAGLVLFPEMAYYMVSNPVKKKK